ncbi:MAG: cytochrome-c oxidase, cbb3-type subunit [Pseudomonadota bacterium]|jgi:cytochrome c oxidase cbb3-type subunit 3
MADFFSEGWSIYIIVLVLLGIAACFLLLWSQGRMKVKLGSDGKPLPVETTGHIWDGDLVENNHPLPGWWRWLFYGTLVFSLGYLVFYPGLGALQGKFGWSQVGQYEEEMKAGEAQFGSLYNRFLKMEVTQVARDPQARAMGERMFLNSCAQCHGSDAQGSKGFPNLTDGDWLYGGDPQNIKDSITNGRAGQMPSMAAALGGDEDVQNVANYVLSLSDSAHDPIRAVQGKAKFAACGACHGAAGSGNQALGAPNLTDKTWLYGGGLQNVLETINKGRANAMPAHKDILTPAKIHLLTAYVWGMSHSSTQTAAQSTRTTQTSP